MEMPTASYSYFPPVSVRLSPSEITRCRRLEVLGVAFRTYWTVGTTIHYLDILCKHLLHLFT